MKTKEGPLGGVGIGAALVFALGAISFLIRAGFAGFGQPRQMPVPEKRPTVQAQPAELPADFEAQCRAAGL